MLCLDKRYSTKRHLASKTGCFYEKPMSIYEIKEYGGLRPNGHCKESLRDRPLVTIITATYNRTEFLEETIHSVISQGYENIEHIIIDGGSTDGTIDVIKKYDDIIDFWISRPDNSMYEAINHGIELARGDIIAVLNSDDKYASPRIIEQVVANFKKYPQIDALYGDLIRLYKNHIRYKRLFQVNYRQYLLSRKGTFVPHSTLFVTRKCIETIGLYDTRYRYASDYDFILRILKDCRIKYFNQPLTYFREHNNSITSACNTIRPETFLILKEHKIDELSKCNQFIMYVYLWSKYKIMNILH